MANKNLASYIAGKELYLAGICLKSYLPVLKVLLWVIFT